MKRIVAILPNYFGGGKRITDTLVGAIASSDVEFILITDTKYTDSAAPSFSSAIGLPLVGRHFSADMTNELVEAIRPLNADIVWLIGDEYPDLSLLRTAINPGGKVIFHLHSAPFYQVKMRCSTPVKKISERLFHTYSRRYRRRTVETLNDVDRYITLCQGYANQLKQLYPAEADKIRCIYNPAPPQTGLARRDVEDSKNIVYVGRLSYADKRVDNLLRIFARVAPSHPDWKLRIIGDGPARADLEAMAQRLNLTQVEFLGYQPQPDLSDASIICLTSAIEGWPTVLNEGMQHGLAPIAFNCSAGVGELLSDGRGVLVEPGNLDEYARQLTRLMDSPDLRRQIRATHPAFLQSLNINNVTKRWLQIFSL